MNHDSFDQNPPPGTRQRHPRSIFAGVPLITVLVLIAVLGTAVFLNNRFVAALEDCRALMRLYPNMQIVSEQEPGFLQVSGLLRGVYQTDEPASAVENELNRQYARALRENLASEGASDRLSRSWSIESLEDGGSLVTQWCP
jgi:hypothetical protein